MEDLFPCNFSLLLHLPVLRLCLYERCWWCTCKVVWYLLAMHPFRMFYVRYVAEWGHPHCVCARYVHVSFALLSCSITLLHSSVFNILFLLPLHPIHLLLLLLFRGSSFDHLLWDCLKWFIMTSTLSTFVLCVSAGEWMARNEAVFFSLYST